MAMRPWGYVLAILAGLAAAPVAAETVLERPLDLPDAPTAPEREVGRDTQGRATGSRDGTVLRGSDGQATGSVRPNPGGAGGSTLRGPDGSLQGIQPGNVPVQRFQPR